MQKTGGNFDIIIDDGGHSMPQQIISFLTLFPHVKSQGLYVIEDLHTSYWTALDSLKQEKGVSAPTMIAFLKDLIDQMNHVGQSKGKASHKILSSTDTDVLHPHKKDILHITFYGSIAIIGKR